VLVVVVVVATNNARHHAQFMRESGARYFRVVSARPHAVMSDEILTTRIFLLRPVLTLTLTLTAAAAAALSIGQFYCPILAALARSRG
jgi:hypothetical protein